MKPVLLSTAYLPPISWVALCSQRPVILEAKEHYVKQSIRNRASICGANGKLDLVIPVAHDGLQSSPISNVHIAPETGWKRLHWKSLESAYRNAPYFEFYEAELKQLYDRDEPMLFQWNLELIRCLFRFLQMDFNAELTDTYEKTVPDSILDFRNAGSLQRQAPVHYRQVFMPRLPFIPGLSVVDLLFNLGPQAGPAIAQQIVLNGIEN